MATQALRERTGIHTWKGQPVTLVGDPVSAGDRAPDFNLRTVDFKPFHLSDALAGGSRTALFIVVPSVDTSVCSRETRTFSERSGEVPADRIGIFAVSVDLPYAQKRWAEAEGVNRVVMLSDYYDHSFGSAYGVRVKERGLLARSIFIIDKSGTIATATILPEATQEPDYDAVLAAAREAAR